MKYVKRPIVVEAFRYGEEFPKWAEEKCKCIVPGQLIIATPEGYMTAYVGDYIIKGIKDEIYPCKSNIFEALYDEFSE